MKSKAIKANFLCADVEFTRTMDRNVRFSASKLHRNVFDSMHYLGLFNRDGVHKGLVICKNSCKSSATGSVNGLVNNCNSAAVLIIYWCAAKIMSEEQYSLKLRI